MKKKTSKLNKKSGNEQVRVTTSIDKGKTTLDIRVYAPANHAGRANQKPMTTPETSKVSS